TFTSQLAIKSQASLSSPPLDYYYAGESVRYDKVLEDDGQRSISYISYSGARRYIAIQPTITQSTNNSLPASGSYTFQSYSSVRNNPSLSSPEITFYGAVSVVRYDK
ncbi:SH3 domain-containing protein, partial [Streptococcus suis]